MIAVMRIAGAKVSRRRAEALLAMLLLVVLALCVVHFGAEGSSMGATDPCLSLGTGLILVFALVAFWHSSWVVLEPASTRYATPLHLSSPPPKRSLLP